MAIQMLDFVGQVMITMLGMVYPGYQSYKAVKKEDKALQQEWLKYWLVLSVVSGVMLVIEPIMYSRLPLWPLWKVAGIAFLMWPKVKGYEKIYQMVLQPQLDQHEAAIDAATDKLFKAGQEQASNVRPQLDRLVAQGRDFAKKTLNKKAT